MKLRHEITYAAPAAEVHAMLMDRDFRAKALEAMRAVSADIEITDDGGTTTVVIDQLQRTEGIPSFAKKFAGDTTRAIQTEVWSSSTEATLRVEAPGKPTEITATITLVEKDGRTTEVLDGTVKAKVPLVGGKLEGLIGKLYISGFTKEHEAGVAWLAGDR